MLSSLAGIVRASKPLGVMKSEDKQKRAITNGWRFICGGLTAPASFGLYAA